MRTLVLFAVLGLASTTWADVPPPDTTGCNSKAAGDACKTDGNQSGACQTQKCAGRDYSDGGTLQFDCLKCAAGATPAKTGGCAAVPGLAIAGLAIVLALRRR
jgi:hypothetical protein